MHKIIHKATDLPPEWDSLVSGNLYLTIPFLRFLEESQKRDTEYHLFYDQADNLDSVFVLFIYPDFPFFTNTILPFTKKVKMVYYPVPLSKSTLHLGKKTKHEVEECINNIKGFTFLTNIPKEDLLALPYELSYARCIIDVKWGTFDDYLGSLRSHYRYQIQKNLKQTNNLNVREIRPQDFNREMYQLYENVYQRTELKINKAEIAFFQSDYSQIITLNSADKCIGFVQVMQNNDEFVFSLIGMDYNYTGEYNLYMRLLVEVIRLGISKGARIIDLGQTTYDTKRKLGSRIEDLYLQVSHHNKALLSLTLLFRGKLLKKHDYSKTYNVFKETGGKE